MSEWVNGVLLLAGALFSGPTTISVDVGVAHTPEFTIQNPGPATVGVQKWSGVFRRRAYVWETTGGSSKSFDFDQQLETIQGATGTALLRMGFSLNGGAQVDVLQLTSAGGVRTGNASAAAAIGDVIVPNGAIYYSEVGGAARALAWISSTTAIFGNGSGQTQVWGLTDIKFLTGASVLTAAKLSGTSLTLGTGDQGVLPVGMTIKGSDTFATTVDVAGGSLTFSSGIGTGASVASSHTFRTPTAIGTGGTAQTLSTRLTIGAGLQVGSGTTADPGDGFIALPNAAFLTGYFSAAQRNIIGINSSGQVVVGNSTTTTALIQSGAEIRFFSTSTDWRFQDNSYFYVIFQSGQGIWGKGDATATPLSYTHRGANSRGGTDTDVAGGALAFTAGLGTGAAAIPKFVWSMPTVLGSGSTQQVATQVMALGRGLFVGATTVDPGNGNLTLEGGSLALVAATSGKVLWTSQGLYMQALTNQATTQILLEANTTAAGAVDRIRLNSGYTNAATAGTLLGIYAVSTRLFGISFGGDAMHSYSASTAGGNISTTTPTGKFRILAGQTSVTITNALCVSLALNNVRVNVVGVDTTAKTAVAVAGTGSFVVTLNAACTANVDCFYEIVSQA